MHWNTKCKIVVIDGQGGRIGRQLAEALRTLDDAELTVVGTNSAATSNMLKSGAVNGATGENAVKVACRTADIITGPIGILSADSLLGEITPDMAVAVGQSSALKILIPMNKCDTMIVGVEEHPLGELIVKTAEAVEKAVEVWKADRKKLFAE